MYAAEMSNMTDLWLSGVFFSSSEYSKTHFRPGLHPGSRWGSLRRSPRLLSRLGRGTRFGASVVRLPNTNSSLRLYSGVALLYVWWSMRQPMLLLLLLQVLS